MEDHPVTREGFAQLINYQPGFQVCGEAGTATAALAGIQATRPDAAIVDLALGSGGDGIELIKQIVATCPNVPVLVLSTFDEALYAERAMRAGARGYVMKQTSTHEVMNAIRKVLRGELYLTPAMQARLAHRQLRGSGKTSAGDVNSLSDRELEVFQNLGQGLSTKQIAQILHCSVSTIETHRNHIKQKLGLKHGLELLRHAIEWVTRRFG
ncbi:MAG: response regulator transcription factor [Opitutaceae bacterium]|nr:response regulator transcription factor [Opitutaceae bacterium]